MDWSTPTPECLAQKRSLTWETFGSPHMKKRWEYRKALPRPMFVFNPPSQVGWMLPPLGPLDLGMAQFSTRANSSTNITSTDDGLQFLNQCKRKIKYGVPGLTIEEQKRLYEIATGETLP